MVIRSCKNCGARFKARGGQIFCRKECRNNWSTNRVDHERFNRNSNGRISCGTSGALAELVVSADLLRKGFEVFRNVSPTGFCDLIAVKESKVWMIEVRMCAKLSPITSTRIVRRGVTHFAFYVRKLNSYKHAKISYVSVKNKTHLM